MPYIAYNLLHDPNDKTINQMQHVLKLPKLTNGAQIKKATTVKKKVIHYIVINYYDIRIYIMHYTSSIYILSIYMYTMGVFVYIHCVAIAIVHVEYKTS